MGRKSNNKPNAKKTKPKRPRKGKGKRNGTITLTKRTADRHVLYEESVQCIDADLEFFQRIFRRKRGRKFRTLREDFCGTAALATGWVGLHKENRAWGVDLDRPTLDWGIANHVGRLGKKAERLTLIQDDVRTADVPGVEVSCALNFSYQVFKTRAELGGYFKSAYDALGDDGIFFLDCFGGTEAMDTLDEPRTIPAATRPDGTRLPSFTYVWDQAAFNPITHDILCHIHFELPDGSRMEKAFTYDWRQWTLPELQELMTEAGFAEVEVYMEGWNEDGDDGDGVYRRRTKMENASGWVGYVIGIK